MSAKYQKQVLMLADGLELGRPDSKYLLEVAFFHRCLLRLA